jgi:ribosomal protein S18 acetylase RimI-like enzyme
MAQIKIRQALPADYSRVADLTVAAYRGDGQTRVGHQYEPQLRDVASRVASAEVLVAVDEGDDAVLGTVTFALPGTPYAELSKAGEAEFRMLAVDPAAQGRGVGEALVRACLDRAAQLGCVAVVICVRDFSAPAQRLYARLGFQREPSLDWSPGPEINLWGLRHTS